MNHKIKTVLKENYNIIKNKISYKISNLIKK